MINPIDRIEYSGLFPEDLDRLETGDYIMTPLIMPTAYIDVRRADREGVALAISVPNLKRPFPSWVFMRYQLYVGEDTTVLVGVRTASGLEVVSQDYITKADGWKTQIIQIPAYSQELPLYALVKYIWVWLNDELRGVYPERIPGELGSLKKETLEIGPIFSFG